MFFRPSITVPAGLVISQHSPTQQLIEWIEHVSPNNPPPPTIHQRIDLSVYTYDVIARVVNSRHMVEFHLFDYSTGRKKNHIYNQVSDDTFVLVRKTHQKTK